MIHPHSRYLEDDPVRGARLRHGRTGRCMGEKARRFVFPMAQSKKMLLKRIDRKCARVDQQVKYIAAQRRHHGLVDTFSLLWGEAYDLLGELRRVHPGTLA